MPLELLRSNRHPDSALDEELSPTDCSEDSVEIRSPRPIILRPSAILAAPPNSTSTLKRSCKSQWMDASEQPDEKRMRRMMDSTTTAYPVAGLVPPPPPPSLAAAAAFYPGGGALSALKLAASTSGHPLLDADRNRLLHHWMSGASRLTDDVPSWMRTNWPLVPPMPEAAHLMTSALHYYPHLLQSYGLPPPHSPIMAPSFLHPPPPMYLPYGLHHPLYHRPAGLDAVIPSALLDSDKTHPPVASPCRPAFTSPPPHRKPHLPEAAAVAPDVASSPDKEAAPERLAAAVCNNNEKIPASRIKSPSCRMKRHRKLPMDSSGDDIRPPKKPKSKICSSTATTGSVPAFLSVETLLGRERTIDVVNDASAEPEEEEEESWTQPRPAFREHPHLPGTTQLDASSSTTSRNYKNMTRERRMQANARERTRVHTISAAFEALRKAVPSFSHGQRLSKLSILRVASAYIAALGQLAGDDDDGDDDAIRNGGTASLSECVDRCTRTLMTEGQMLRRKRPGASRQQTNSTGEANATDDDEDDD